MFGILYLLWEFVPEGVESVWAQARRPDHSVRNAPPAGQQHYRPAPTPRARHYAPPQYRGRHYVPQGMSGAFTPRLHYYGGFRHYYHGIYYRYVIVENHCHVYDDVTGIVIGVFASFGDCRPPVVVINLPTQPLPPPSQNYPAPAPVVQEPQVQPQERYRSGLFLNGGSPEVQAAVKKELLAKKVAITADRSQAASELRISEKIIGDPWFRIDLELIDLEVNRTVSASDGSYPYKSRSEWGKLEAIREAAHAAVSSLKYL